MNQKQQINSNDWRLQGQEQYLNKVTLVFRDYFPYRADWNHDHCEFCNAKFSLSSDDLKKGYSTEDGYYWICEQCFNDFLHIFQWHVCLCPAESLSSENSQTENEGSNPEINTQ